MLLRLSAKKVQQRIDHFSRILTRKQPDSVQCDARSRILSFDSVK